MSSKDKQKGDPTPNSSANDSIDLFFDLPARVISKLFRPKRPLCGQPLTLNVSGTTFCCRAELFDALQITPSTVGGDGNEHPLVLFSVIVALAPLRSNILANSHACSQKADKAGSVDSAFTTIERIHINLARLCSVLTREERRCQYVTLQCQMLLAVRKEYEGRLLPTKDGSKSSANGDDSNTNSARRVSNTPAPSTKGATQTIAADKRTVLQTPSGPDNVNSSGDVYSAYNADEEKNMNPAERREYIQQLIELMFASTPPESNHGNLARELAEVFHFLSRHDDPAAPTCSASAVLSRAAGKDIYINQHVAVPFESMDISSALPISATSLVNPPHDETVQPHQTLLFPSMSASEVLRALSDESLNLSYSVGTSTSTVDTSASVSVSHAMRRMLTQLHPSKTLKEVASDSALSVNQGKYIIRVLDLVHRCFDISLESLFVSYLKVLEAAKWLISSGMCVAAMPVTRRSRYVCVEGVVNEMRRQALPFWQAFSSKAKHCQFCFDDKNMVTGAPHIFLIVSALTSNSVASSAEKENKTSCHAASAPLLGDVIDSLSGNSNEQSSWNVQSAKSLQEKGSSMIHRFERPRSLGSVGSSNQKHEEPSSVDSIIYSMAVWLAANGVICPVDC